MKWNAHASRSHTMIIFSFQYWARTHECIPYKAHQQKSLANSFRTLWVIRHFLCCSSVVHFSSISNWCSMCACACASLHCVFVAFCVENVVVFVAIDAFLMDLNRFEFSFVPIGIVRWFLLCICYMDCETVKVRIYSVSIHICSFCWFLCSDGRRFCVLDCSWITVSINVSSVSLCESMTMRKKISENRLKNHWRSRSLSRSRHLPETNCHTRLKKSRKKAQNNGRKENSITEWNTTTKTKIFTIIITRRTECNRTQIQIQQISF